MYLSKSNRWATLIVLIIGLLLTFISVIGALSEKNIWVGIIVFVLFALPCLIFGVRYFFYLFSEASKTGYQRDVFKVDFKFDKVAEHNGVQYMILVSPDEVAPPAYLMISVFLQNCHSRPRNVGFIIYKTPFKTGRLFYSASLKGGEAGILQIPAFLETNQAAGEYLITYNLKAKITEGVGMRVIKRDGLPGRFAGGKKYTFLTVLPSTGQALNEHIKNKEGFTTVFHPPSGITEPLLESVSFLDSLQKQ